VKTNPPCPDWFKDRRTVFQPHESVSCEFLKEAVAQNAFQDSPLTIAEVGSRGGSDPIWSAFATQRISHAFEPGNDETAEASAANDRLTRNIPLALWKTAGRLRINLPEKGETASVFRPNLPFFRRFPRHEHMRVRSTFVVPATTLDRHAAVSRTAFDVVTLDVQGAELAVLQGAGRQLRSSVMAVIAEVSFVELYKKQPLFTDVDRFMARQGFSLWDLDLRRWEKRPRTAGPGMRGQIIYGDALYFREPMSDAGIARHLKKNRTQARKYVALAELLGAVDLALETVDWLRSHRQLSAVEARTWTRKLISNQTCLKRSR